MRIRQRHVLTFAILLGSAFGFPRAHAQETRVKGTVSFDKDAYEPGEEIRLDVKLDKPLQADLRGVIVYFELAAERGDGAAPATTYNGMSASASLTSRRPSSLGIGDDVPLRRLSPRHFRISDIRANRWLPEGPYSVRTMTIMRDKGKGQAREVIARVDVSEEGASGIKGSPRPARFRLLGTDPDDVNPLISSVTMLGRGKGSGVPIVTRGEAPTVIVSYEDDKSGLRDLSLVFMRVVPRDGKYEVADVGEPRILVKCSFGKLPLKGNATCPADALAEAEPGLYAPIFVMAGDQRAWGLNQDLSWAADWVSGTPAGLVAKPFDELAMSRISRADSATVQHWTSLGRPLSFKAALINIVGP